MAHTETAGVDRRPLYVQVKEALLQRLAGEYWRPGELLPSEPKLAREFDVSQGTVRRALEELAAQNLIVRQQGRGTAVATHTPDRALFGFFHLLDGNDSRQLPESRALRLRVAAASQAEQRVLELDAGDEVIRIRRLRLLATKPKIVEDISLAYGLFAGLESTPLADLPNTLYVHYQQRFNVSIVRAVERVRAVAATRGDAQLLDVEAGTPLLEIERIAFGHRQHPIEWRVSRCRTDAHHYHNVLE